MLGYASALKEDRIFRESRILGLGLRGENSERVSGALRAIADDTYAPSQQVAANVPFRPRGGMGH